MRECELPAYTPLAGKAPEIQAELLARNLVKVYTALEICSQRQAAEAEWIENNN